MKTPVFQTLFTFPLYASPVKMLKTSNKTNKIHLPNILVAAGLLVNKKNQVLIAQRPMTKTMAGLWEFPGGKVESGEIPVEALARELKEELGITVVADTLIFLSEVTHAYEDFYLTMPLFLCRRWHGELAPLEGQKLVWVDPVDLKNFPMPPADAPLIGKIPAFLEQNR